MSKKTKLGFLIFFLTVFCGGKGTPSVNRESVSYLQKHCSLGDAESCLSMGYIYLRGILDEDERDFKLASDYFMKACDSFKDLNRKQLQCEAIAKIFENGKEARPDRKIAALFHSKSDEAKMALQKKLAVSDTELTDEWTRCRGGSVANCFHLGENYLKAEHLNLKKAEESFMLTCDKKNRKDKVGEEEYPGKFCGLVAEIYEYGRQGLSQDLKKAGKIYELACEIANSSASTNGFMCDLAGNFFRDKKISRSLAAALYKKGCSLGLQDSCVHFKGISSAGF